MQMYHQRRGRTHLPGTPANNYRRDPLASPPVYSLELQRMFEHSNIIRLRFSRTNFFYERTFVDVRWSVFDAHIAERSFGRGLARGSHARMALLLKSCVDACQCHVPERSAEKEAVTWTFNLKRSMKDNPSKVPNTQVAEIWNNSSVLRQAPCSLAASKQRQVTLEEVSCSFLFGCSSKSFMERTTCSSCALCALCRQASLYTAQPHPHCFLRHKEGAGAGSTSSAAVSLTTNDMEKSSSAGICNHDWLAIGWRLQSQINAQVRQATFWDTHRSSCSGELRQATDGFALVDEEIIEVVTVYEKAREVQFAGDNGVVDTIQDEADEKTLFQNRKFAQLDLHEVLTLQSSLSGKAAVGASMLCLQKQGQLSPGFVWEWWAGRRSVCQPRDDRQCCKADSRILWSCRFKRYPCPNQLVCFRAQTTIASRYYH